jgi:hypothetical protein
MSDIFREVDEDLRREQVKRLWDRFAPYIIGAAVLIVVATAGYRGWEYFQERQAQATGDRFLAALQLSEEGKHAEALAAYQAVSGDGSGGYPLLARFSAASAKAQTGDTAGAIADFDAIAADRSTPAEVQNLARLRAAFLLVDTSTVADLEARIGELAATGNAWRHSAREILGLGAWRTGDYAAARKYFNDIASDQGTTDDLRQRAGLMLALLGAKLGPEAPATTTPAPAPPATPPAAPATP